MIPIRIRPATAADAAEIVRLTTANAAFYGWSEELRATPETVCRDGFGDERLFWAFLAEVDRAPVGMIQYFFVYNPWTATRGIRVTDLYVDEAARGRRVGRQLMATVAHQAPRDGLRSRAPSLFLIVGAVMARWMGSTPPAARRA